MRLWSNDFENPESELTWVPVLQLWLPKSVTLSSLLFDLNISNVYTIFLGHQNVLLQGGEGDGLHTAADPGQLWYCHHHLRDPRYSVPFAMLLYLLSVFQIPICILIRIRIRIRIRILVRMDPYWKCGSGRKLTKLTNKPDFQPFKMALYLRRYRTFYAKLPK